MKKPIEVLVLEKQTIKLYDESRYAPDSSESKTYDKTFISGDKDYSTSLIGIELTDNDGFTTSCLIGAEGGLTAINGNTTLISYGGIVICCSNTIFKLTLPDLNLEWKTIADSAACFGIDYLDQDYIVHGELEITRLDKEGKIVWQNGGRDILTTPEGIDVFAVYDDYILVTDWDYNRYKFDFDGNVIEEYKVQPRKEEITSQTTETKKWWQFW
jgi:hypothetical protein